MACDLIKPMQSAERSVRAGMTMWKYILICVSLCSQTYGRGIRAYGYWNEPGGFAVTAEKRDFQEACVVGYIDISNFNVTGWGIVELNTSRVCTNEQQAYLAGYMEGMVTWEAIYQHWYNTMSGICQNRHRLCQKMKNFINQNSNWIKKNIEKYDGDHPYWYQVKLFYKQVEGLHDGYKQMVTNPSQILDYEQLLWLNLQGDIEELMDALSERAEDEEYESFIVRGAKIPGSRSCSALVKLLPRSKDLYTSHDTWSSFESMFKVLKKYNFDYTFLPNSSISVPGKAISFSSYPGEIQSGDDFYVTSAGLTIMETTTGNNNPKLWKRISPKGQIFEQIRTMVANRLSYTGKDWVRVFSQYNSGTYNNQWMIVDYKQFKAGMPRRRLKSGLLYVLEQLPGFVKAADKTDVLKKQSYWPSYNIPYFPEIYNMSDNWKNVKKYGDWFRYDKNPRALMFKRDHKNVKNIDTMIALMRYNDYKHDPLSRCNCVPPYSGENTIACRNDVMPKNGTYPFPALGHRDHSATDMKLTSSKLIKSLQFYAVSGPPFNENVPPFQWSTSDFKDHPHLGQPDLWTFKPYLHTWNSHV